jgi:hypothetical protein
MTLSASENLSMMKADEGYFLKATSSEVNAEIKG